MLSEKDTKTNISNPLPFVCMWGLRMLHCSHSITWQIRRKLQNYPPTPHAPHLIYLLLLQLSFSFFFFVVFFTI